ncbi:hypothetical protein PC9H_006867 [Pleurotus ostreatus]|uniref:Uncharacterized protein n=1 Tax=Pleurotus ostreatus TaxID=5322 RepID=A0A8H7DW00_PLEOS|nr:uncharacterized protein PC9H_006867 [Pleurotus ostreatus]KAF7431147.1 hypothetical protein PC9H_006867 [Pleurotus ostreatus]
MIHQQDINDDDRLKSPAIAELDALADYYWLPPGAVPDSRGAQAYSIYASKHRISPHEGVQALSSRVCNDRSIDTVPTMTAVAWNTLSNQHYGFSKPRGPNAKRLGRTMVKYRLSSINPELLRNLFPAKSPLGEHWAPGSCAEFTTLTEVVLDSLPSSRERMVVHALAVRTKLPSEKWGFCKVCQRYARNLVKRFPGLAIVDLGSEPPTLYAAAAEGTVRARRRLSECGSATVTFVLTPTTETPSARL